MEVIVSYFIHHYHGSWSQFSPQPTVDYSPLRDQTIHATPACSFINTNQKHTYDTRRCLRNMLAMNCTTIIILGESIEKIPVQNCNIFETAREFLHTIHSQNTSGLCTHWKKYLVVGVGTFGYMVVLLMYNDFTSLLYLPAGYIVCNCLRQNKLTVHESLRLGLDKKVLFTSLNLAVFILNIFIHQHMLIATN